MSANKLTNNKLITVIEGINHAMQSKDCWAKICIVYEMWQLKWTTILGCWSWDGFGCNRITERDGFVFNCINIECLNYYNHGNVVFSWGMFSMNTFLSPCTTVWFSGCQQWSSSFVDGFVFLRLVFFVVNTNAVPTLLPSCPSAHTHQIFCLTTSSWKSLPEISDGSNWTGRLPARPDA